IEADDAIGADGARSGVGEPRQRRGRGAGAEKLGKRASGKRHVSSCVEEDTPHPPLRGTFSASGRSALAMLTASAPLPLAGEGGRPGEGSLLRYGALGRFGQAGLVAVRGVALDEALLGRLVDLGQTCRP